MCPPVLYRWLYYVPCHLTDMRSYSIEVSIVSYMIPVAPMTYLEAVTLLGQLAPVPRACFVPVLRRIRYIQNIWRDRIIIPHVQIHFHSQFRWCSWIPELRLFSFCFRATGGLVSSPGKSVGDRVSMDTLPAGAPVRCGWGAGTGLWFLLVCGYGGRSALCFSHPSYHLNHIPRAEGTLLLPTDPFLRFQ